MRLSAVCFFLFVPGVAALLAGAPADARAESETPLAAITDFFRVGEGIPPSLRDALDAYENRRYFAVLRSLGPVLETGEPAYAVDDALFLQALSLIGLGWDDPGVEPLRSLLEAEDPGPYYVPALLELVELHERAGRLDAVAEAWSRWVDRPLHTSDARGKRVTELLFEFGTLRPPVAGSTRREKKWLSRPKELAVVLEKRRERAADRLLYRCGLALLRLGRHEESRRALLMIGIESPYYPYARYAIAQNLFALGEADAAMRTLVRLARYPKIVPEEQALGSRAKVLLAALRFEAGELERGIRVARSIEDDDPEAPRARLLVTTALIDAGEPALAVVYDPPLVPALADAEAKRALTLSAAYTSLGDADSAARILRDAAGRLRAARDGSGPARDGVVDRLFALAERLVEDRRIGERRRHAYLSDGIRVVLAHDGPWSLGTMFRRLRAVLGAGAHRELAAGIRVEPTSETPSEEHGSLAYLNSPRRAAIERALDHLAGLAAVPVEPEGEGALRILNAQLFLLERAPSREAGRPVAVLRRELAGAARAPVVTTIGAATSADRDDTMGRLRDWIAGELFQVLREHTVELRALELDLEVALSGALVTAGGPR